MAVAVAGVWLGLGADTIFGPAHGTALGTQQGADERRQHGAHQTRRRLLELFCQETGRIDTMRQVIE